MKILAVFCIFLVLWSMSSYDVLAEAPLPTYDAEEYGAYSLPLSFLALVYNGQRLSSGKPSVASGIAGVIAGSATAVSGIMLLQDEVVGSGSVFTAFGGVAAAVGAANIISAIRRTHAASDRSLAIEPVVYTDRHRLIYGIQICVGF